MRDGRQGGEGAGNHQVQPRAVRAPRRDRGKAGGSKERSRWIRIKSNENHRADGGRNRQNRSRRGFRVGGGATWIVKTIPTKLAVRRQTPRELGPTIRSCSKKFRRCTLPAMGMHCHDTAGLCRSGSRRCPVPLPLSRLAIISQSTTSSYSHPPPAPLRTPALAFTCFKPDICHAPEATAIGIPHRHP